MSTIAKLHRRARTLVLGSALALGIFGCKKKPPTGDELLTKYRAVIEPRVTNYEKIAKAPLPAANGSIKLAGPPMEMIGTSSHPPSGNATYAFVEDLRDLTRFGNVELRTSDDMELANHCVMLVRKHSLASYSINGGGMRAAEWDEYMASDVLEPCALLRYVVIVKTSAFKASEYVDKKSFIGGNVSGELLVFDLDTGAFAGGVRFAAESSDSTKGASDADLRSNFYSAIAAALRKALPGATKL